jgi:DNA-binding transcriptional regulator YiaG
MKTRGPAGGKSSAKRPGGGAKPSTSRAAPAKLGPFARKLNAAFREIVAGNVTVREVEIPPPTGYSASAVRATRDRLRVSVAVFARLLGVSAKLVEHWEQGRRVPSSLAARLLDRVNADPDGFRADLMKGRKVAG